ncbi:MAG TPA: pyridoxamine 5'-phosphate oxidase family protein [Ferruginibacter sp.]|nr:pyridoxamine 5'-phosphate oxidase family protein [Ferruginibacter sp.]
MNHLDENLTFLKEKIKDIKIALFKSEINSELQLPNNIIQTLKVEDDGHIWFLTSCTGDYAKNVARSFYAYLDYYKKGTECRLQVSGRANIIEDDDDAFLAMSNYSKGIASRLVLVRMKIMQAEYFENKQYDNVSWKEKLKGALNSLFFTHSHRVYDFS